MLSEFIMAGAYQFADYQQAFKDARKLYIDICFCFCLKTFFWLSGTLRNFHTYYTYRLGYLFTIFDTAFNRPFKG